MRQPDLDAVAEELRPRVAGGESLQRDLSLHNDMLFSLLPVCQLVIDLGGELSARRGLRFEDYTSGPPDRGRKVSRCPTR